ncbi:MAG: hypothetical protein WBD22_10175 [Pyrinomonadaceae bacterium]
MKVNIIIEKGMGEIWGRIEESEFLVSCGKDLTDVTDNLRALLADYIGREGKMDKRWKKVNIDSVHFGYVCDTHAFFESFDFLNISAVAKAAGINQSLLRQYAKSIKHPSAERVRAIERTVHDLAEQMRRVSLVPA